jgi:hypothetical protein
MNTEESKRVEVLCAKIISEKDPATFSKLVEELNELMSAKEERLRTPVAPKPADGSSGL